MATYGLTVTVRNYFEVEADSIEEAEALGWKYEDLTTDQEVDKIEADEVEADEEDED